MTLRLQKMLKKNITAIEGITSFHCFLQFWLCRAYLSLSQSDQVLRIVPGTAFNNCWRRAPLIPQMFQLWLFLALISSYTFRLGPGRCVRSSITWPGWSIVWGSTLLEAWKMLTWILIGWAVLTTILATVTRSFDFNHRNCIWWAIAVHEWMHALSRPAVQWIRYDAELSIRILRPRGILFNFINFQLQVRKLGIIKAATQQEKKDDQLCRVNDFQKQMLWYDDVSTALTINLSGISNTRPHPIMQLHIFLLFSIVSIGFSFHFADVRLYSQ